MRVVVAATVLAAFCLSIPTPAQATELTTKVFAATLEPGLTEFELRYGRIVGDEATGEDGLLFEAAHHFSSRFYGGIELETSREPGGDRKIAAFGAEGIVTLGKVAGVNVAMLGEYAANLHTSDAIETRLLVEKRADEFNVRLNLNAEKILEHGEPLEFSYAASVDRELAEDFRLGLMGIGELGTSKHLTARGEHFLGPVAKYEVEHLPRGELELEAGYLLPLGEARHDTDGLVRLMVEYGIRF